MAAAALVAEAFGVLVALGLTGAGAGVIGLVLLAQHNSVPDSAPAYDARRGWAALHREVRRSRRYGRPFVLAAAPGDLNTAAALQSMLRTPDHAWIDGSTVYTLLTECDRMQAFGFLQRARAAVPSLLADDQFHLASFPGDAITVGALLEALQPEAGLVHQPSTPTIGALIDTIQANSDTARVAQPAGSTRDVA